MVFSLTSSNDNLMPPGQVGRGWLLAQVHVAAMLASSEPLGILHVVCVGGRDEESSPSQLQRPSEEAGGHLGQCFDTRCCQKSMCVVSRLPAKSGQHRGRPYYVVQSILPTHLIEENTKRVLHEQTIHH